MYVCSLALFIPTGRQAYSEEKWLEAKDHFENSLEEFKNALSDCYFLCEDLVHVNLTQPNMSPTKKGLLEEYGFKSDTMEYYELLGTTFKKVSYTLQDSSVHNACGVLVYVTFELMHVAFCTSFHRF